MQISCAINAQLISAFVFATWIVEFFLLLNPKFQASSLFLQLHILVCVRPGQKPRIPVFSCHGSNINVSFLHVGRNTSVIHLFIIVQWLSSLFCSFKCLEYFTQYMCMYILVN